MHALVFRKLCYCSSVWSRTDKEEYKQITQCPKLRSWDYNPFVNDHITPVLKKN